MGAINSKSKRDPMLVLFETQVPLIFTLTELTWWKAILSKWFNIVVTFAWSFMDLFVMVVSIGLASIFKQINIDLQQMKGRVIITDLFFSKIFQLIFFFHSSTLRKVFGYCAEFNIVKWCI